MTLPILTIIPAGAGSGKTHRIQTDIAAWIKAGQVNPSKVLAVTFTEAAAGELRQRIRAELIQEGMIKESIQLNEAMISTIHGFGLRILRDYCLEGDLSPDATLLSEEEQIALSRTVLSIPIEADAIIANFNHYGYRYDFNSESTASDQFRDRVLKLIALLRVLGRDQLDAELYQAAEQYLKQNYGQTGNANQLNKGLHTAVTQLLKQFPRSVASYATSDSAQTKLHKNFKTLQKAANLAVIETDWALWADLQDLQKSNRNFTLPAGYDDLADDVMEAAKCLPQHPGPLDDALIHVKAIFKTADTTLDAYQKEKQQAGLLDYTDMLALADRLLQRQEILEHLAKRFDCLVIDEFQDTNPLQFSLLYRLQQTGIPTLIVGDTKQAIMRFQHADARLMQVLQQQKGVQVKPLTGNWRTQKPLLDWINAMGSSLFGDDYIELEAKTRFQSKLLPLEIIEQQAKSKETTHYFYTALRIKTLLTSSNTQIYDKKTGQHRPIKGSDIAVLHPRSKGLERMASALRELGVAVRKEEDGWFGSAIVQLLYYALSYVADPTDRHAALYLVTSECGSLQLQQALQCCLDKQALNDPILEHLQSISEHRKQKTVTTLLHDIIARLNIYDLIACWSDGKQARANVIRLIAEAEKFANANTNTLNSAGIYGNDLKSFLVWLTLLAEQNDAQPHAQAVSENAVHLVTWHSAKGREWPVVAVCGLESEVAPRIPGLETEYTDFKAIDKILENARINFIPSFAAKDTQKKFSNLLLPAVENDATCLLYVALTRAREMLLLEWPSHQLKKAHSYLHVLVGDDRMSLTNEGINVQGKTFKANIVQCGKDMPVDYQQQVQQKQTTVLPVEFRHAIKPVSYTLSPIAETVSPSLLKGAEVDWPMGKLESIELGRGITLNLEAAAEEKGTIMHRALEVLAGDAKRNTLLKQALPALSEQDVEQIAQFSQLFEVWLEKRFQPIAVGREVPLLCLDDNRSVVSGLVDLLVETAEGYWVLDYKSDNTSNIEERYQQYRPQLIQYVRAVGKTDIKKTLLGMGIVWLKNGRILIEGFGS